MDKEKIYFITKKGTNNRLWNGDGVLRVDEENIERVLKDERARHALFHQQRTLEEVNYPPLLEAMSVTDFEEKFYGAEPEPEPPQDTSEEGEQ